MTELHFTESFKLTLRSSLKTLYTITSTAVVHTHLTSDQTTKNSTNCQPKKQISLTTPQFPTTNTPAPIRLLRAQTNRPRPAAIVRPHRPATAPVRPSLKIRERFTRRPIVVSMGAAENSAEPLSGEHLLRARNRFALEGLGSESVPPPRCPVSPDAVHQPRGLGAFRARKSKQPAEPSYFRASGSRAFSKRWSPRGLKVC